MSKKTGIILNTAILHIYLGVYLAICLTPSLAYADNTITVELSPSEYQIEMNLEVAVNELSLGRLDSATILAKKALADTQKIKGTWNYDNFVRLAHTVLGLIDVRLGKMPAARAALDAIAKTPAGPPRLGNSGPNLSLAKALLNTHPANAQEAQANKKAVTDYLDNLAKTSKDPSILSKIPLWKSQIALGNTPDFGPDSSFSLNTSGSNSTANRCESVTEESVDCNGRHYVRDESAISGNSYPVQQIIDAVPGSGAQDSPPGNGAAVTNGQ